MKEIEPEFRIYVDPSLSDKIIVNVQTIYSKSGYQISKMQTLYYKGEKGIIEATAIAPTYYRFFVSDDNKYFGDSGIVYNYMFRRPGHKNSVDIVLDNDVVALHHTVGDSQFDWKMKINQKYDDIVRIALEENDSHIFLYDLLATSERTENNYKKFYDRVFFNFFNKSESNTEVVPISDSKINYYKNTI